MAIDIQPHEILAVTCAAYEPDNIPVNYQHLLSSAKAFNIDLLSVDTSPFLNFYENKCVRLRQYLAEVFGVKNDRYKAILYVDANDCVFAGGLDVIADKLNAFLHGNLHFILAGESAIWPWERRHKHFFDINYPNTDRRYPNAGCFIATWDKFFDYTGRIQNLNQPTADVRIMYRHKKDAPEGTIFYGENNYDLRSCDQCCYAEASMFGLINPVLDYGQVGIFRVLNAREHGLGISYSTLLRKEPLYPVYHLCGPKWDIPNLWNAIKSFEKVTNVID